MTTQDPKLPLLAWKEMAQALNQCADHMESSALAYSNGDFGSARAHLDNGRGARAHLHVLQTQFRREAPEHKEDLRHAQTAKQQMMRFKAAAEAVKLILEHFHRNRTPNPTPTDDDIHHAIDVSIPGVWDPHRDLVLVLGTASSGYARILAKRGFKRVLLLLDSPTDEVEDLPNEVFVAKSLEDARGHGRSLLNPPPRRMCTIGLPGQRSDEEAEELKQTVADALRGASQFIATLAHFGEKLAGQTIINLPRLLVLPSFNQLKLSMPEVPALVICPGPSLGDALDTVAELKGKAILIAVSHALHPLLNRGIIPDIVVSIDAGEGTLTQFEGLDLSSIPLAVLGVSAPAPLYRLPTLKRVASISCNGPAEAWIHELHGTVSRVPTGGTVAHAATFLALKMGCTNIGFIGQDLAYRGNKMYASGTAAAIEVTESKDAKLVLEGGVERMRYEVEGWDGKPLVTSQAFNAYRIWYQDLVKVKPSIRFVNGSVGGARIEGMHHMPLHEWAEEWADAHPISDTLTSAFDGAIPSGDGETRAIKAIKSRMRMIDDVAKLAGKGHKLNERFARGAEVGPAVSKSRKKLVKRSKEVPEVAVYIDNQINRIINLGQGTLSQGTVVEAYRDLFQALGRATRELKGAYAQALSELQGR